MQTNSAQPMLTEKDLSKLLPISLHALRRWRTEGRGPKFIKVGGTLVRYRMEDVEKFLRACPTGGDGRRAGDAA
jgi:predicted DNA-binding transcriptional regulator AlpA